MDQWKHWGPMDQWKDWGPMDQWKVWGPVDKENEQIDKEIINFLIVRGEHIIHNFNLPVGMWLLYYQCSFGVIN